MTWLRERGTHGSALTVVSPPPLASSRIHRPGRRAERRRQQRWHRWPRGRRPVVMPSPASFLAVFGPTPHSASTSRSPITAIQLASVSW